MNLKWTLDPKLGGKIRAVLAAAVFVGALAATVAGAIDWSAPIAASIPAILQALAHFSTVGNKS